MLSIANIKYLAIIIVLLVILSAVIIMGTLQTQPSPPPQPTQPRSVQPTSFFNLAPPSISPSSSIDDNFIEYSQQYLEQQEKITQEERSTDKQALIVSSFIDKLPITGQYIKVTYNIYNNQVYSEYDRDNKEAATKEFANLLKENQIQDINWLYNLQIIER